MKKVVWLVGFAFGGTTATRVWQIKTQNTNIQFGVLGIILSYGPAMVYYQYHQHLFNNFLDDVSERYRDRIRDD